MDIVPVFQSSINLMADHHFVFKGKYRLPASPKQGGRMTGRADEKNEHDVDDHKDDPSPTNKKQRRMDDEEGEESTSRQQPMIVTTTALPSSASTAALPITQTAIQSRLFVPERLPPELRSVDFSKRITWSKYAPYEQSRPAPLIPIDAEPLFTSSSPALCHYLNAISKRARACTIHLKPQSGQSAPVPIATPRFMPVGTKGCIKGVTMEELSTDPALSCPILLANTYHLAIQPGTELVRDVGGLHAFQGTKHAKYNLLTDSGGFQMVSLVKLSQVSEEGVSFENPYKQGTPFHKEIQQQQHQQNQRQQPNEFKDKQKGTESSPALSIDHSSSDMLLLKPEDSIRHQNNIGANIIMALDDVISSISDDDERFLLATHRTLRWYDRCVEAHSKADVQNLFPIVQGGLDTQLGGLREQCLAGFRHRHLDKGYIIPGFAIGGLAGGESKDAFWRVVDQCCRALPDDKPRYLMGVGYPLDLVVCTALGVDLYDCVYPTRTARFGVALVPGGTLKVKSHEFMMDHRVLQDGCGCQACRLGVSRSRLQALQKANNPLALQFLTQHNLAYMMGLCRDMRQAILDDRYADFANRFVHEYFPSGDVPKWVIEALAATGIVITASNETA